MEMPRVQSQLHKQLALWFLVSYLTSVGLDFSIYKMGLIIIIPTLKGVHIKHLVFTRSDDDDSDAVCRA